MSHDGTMSMTDQRRFLRFGFRNPVQYHYLDEGKEVSGGCMGRDLSAGGLRFYSENFIPLHTDVDVHFCFDVETMATFKGRVVWIQRLPHAESYAVGLDFSRNVSNRQSQKELQQYFQSVYP